MALFGNPDKKFFDALYQQHIHKQNTPEQIYDAMKNSQLMGMYPSVPPTPPVTIESASFRTSVLRQRMRWSTDEGPLQALHTHHIKSENKVILFVLYRDKPIIMEDDAGMFPSDTLVTQFRLLTE
jgi:hypothetical protein